MKHSPTREAATGAADTRGTHRVRAAGAVLAAVLAGMAVGTMALSACTQAPGPDEAPTLSAAEASTGRTGNQTTAATDSAESPGASPEPSDEQDTDRSGAEFVDVAPERFAAPGGAADEIGIFATDVGADAKVTCTFSDDRGTYCTATPDDSAPDLEDMGYLPFTGRPGAFATSGAEETLDDAGFSWGVFEGVPPAGGELRPGERLKTPTVTCQRPDATRLECASDGRTFAIVGPDRHVEADVTLAEHPGD
ncbi:hypothetical protein CFRA_02560 [Corynebacterium frankenforstense DSM 45800]|uniref:Uncharacterized protein n=1 Tax=Corynebacterium frankenforstense DSM 45800 TaxID=1437875 RepID=A0A1L7CR96_9CORY|nr:hypothetical protein [Corynebacterium frankenforstense]APT88341.1 hypothetical protein CFRA_02560 [Corynebacterium frankenforstense DSM 45800]